VGSSGQQCVQVAGSAHAPSPPPHQDVGPVGRPLALARRDAAVRLKVCGVHVQTAAAGEAAGGAGATAAGHPPGGDLARGGGCVGAGAAGGAACHQLGELHLLLAGQH
jgi:hypothetical protein